MMDKKFLISAIIALGLTALGLFLLARVSQFSGPAARLKLSDFPEVFGKDALIVIGDETCERELRAAKEIAEYLKNVTGNEPEIKRCSEIAAEDKRNYNLMVIGTPESNKMLREIYGISDALGVNESFPGEGKGVLEILPNPWNKDRAMLLVEGSDGEGLKHAREYLLTYLPNTSSMLASEIRIHQDGWFTGGTKTSLLSAKPEKTVLHSGEKFNIRIKGFLGGGIKNATVYFKVYCDGGLLQERKITYGLRESEPYIKLGEFEITLSAPSAAGIYKCRVLENLQKPPSLKNYHKMVSFYILVIK